MGVIMLLLQPSLLLLLLTHAHVASSPVGSSQEPPTHLNEKPALDAQLAGDGCRQSGRRRRAVQCDHGIGLLVQPRHWAASLSGKLQFENRRLQVERPPASPPPSPPPLTPGGKYEHITTATLTLTGDISDFGADAILALRSKLAAEVGVEARFITLRVSSASVVVTATIVFPNQAAVRSSAEQTTEMTAHGRICRRMP